MAAEAVSPASVHTRALAAIVEAVKAQDLPGIGGERVYERQGKRTGVTQDYPCVEVRRGPRPDQVGETFRVNLPTYAYQLTFRERDPLTPETDSDRADGWAERLTEVFHGKELAGVPEVWQVLVEPLPPLDESREEYQLAIGGLTLLVFTHSLTAVRT